MNPHTELQAVADMVMARHASRVSQVTPFVPRKPDRIALTARLVMIMAKHDEYFMYSSDYAVYMLGQSEKMEIAYLRSQLDQLGSL